MQKGCFFKKRDGLLRVTLNSACSVLVEEWSKMLLTLSVDNLKFSLNKTVIKYEIWFLDFSRPVAA